MAFVENIGDIMNVPDETLFIVDQTSASPDNSQDVRIDVSAEEDIKNIEQFLGQALETSTIGATNPMGDDSDIRTVVELMVPVDSSKGHLGIHHMEDQPSEDIDEIQRFLERSQVDQPEVLFSSTGGVVKDEPPPPVKYKIPKSPEFKKRFQNKEIVKIVKGTDSHKNYEKIQVKKVKPVAPSFEDQLHEAELVDMRTTIEKKRKWKNKSSTRDYMITKKYAKIVGPSKKEETPVEESENSSSDKR